MNLTIQSLMKHRLLILIAFCISVLAQGQGKLPSPVGFVNDFAGVLDGNDRAALEAFLQAYKDSSGNEIAIVIESSLNGGDEFQRSLDYARNWKIGEEGVNNGVLIYIAIEDHKIFIQTADKTQGVMTDYVTKLIIEEDIAPEFKKGNYSQGLYNGAVAITKVLAGEFKPPKHKAGKGKHIPFAGLIIVIIIFIIISRINRRNRGGGLGRRGLYTFPDIWLGGGGRGGWGGGSSGGGGFGGFGGGGGFNGGGAGGSW